MQVESSSIVGIRLHVRQDVDRSCRSVSMDVQTDVEQEEMVVQGLRL